MSDNYMTKTQEPCPLHKGSAHVIKNVSKTALVHAIKHSTIMINRERYTYLPDSDELVRDDVLAWRDYQP